MSQPGREGPAASELIGLAAAASAETFPFLLSFPQAAPCPKRSAQGTWHRRSEERRVGKECERLV